MKLINYLLYNENGQGLLIFIICIILAGLIQNA